jgi:hypothetical protein
MAIYSTVPVKQLGVEFSYFLAFFSAPAQRSGFDQNPEKRVSLPDVILKYTARIGVPTAYTETVFKETHGVWGPMTIT